jgi:hypothetical protein
MGYAWGGEFVIAVFRVRSLERDYEFLFISSAISFGSGYVHTDLLTRFPK